MKSYKLVIAMSLSMLLVSHDLSAGFFQSGDAKIYFTDSRSSAEAIVLIHGYGMSSSMWHDAGIVEELSKHNRVITLDCRGHGQSDKPVNTDKYGPEVGKDIIKLIDHLEIDKVHMVGYSMGAFTVGRLLVTNPDRVRSAVMASGYFPKDDKEERMFQEETARDMETHGEQALAAVARGWRYDAVSDQQIAEISVPLQAVFGSEEIDDYFDSQKNRLTMPRSALPIVVIEGADHDSNKAAVLHPKFLEMVTALINSAKPKK